MNPIRAIPHEGTIYAYTCAVPIVLRGRVPLSTGNRRAQWLTEGACGGLQMTVERIEHRPCGRDMFSPSNRFIGARSCLLLILSSPEAGQACIAPTSENMIRISIRRFSTPQRVSVADVCKFHGCDGDSRASAVVTFRTRFPTWQSEFTRTRRK
ncbi:hypothetical protein BJV78DRAFT_568356 [Lactifluus subvellereus]|nr:hypothetical protein BJV78DRAFT_568356 [Lactifluus subvellereus]